MLCGYRSMQSHLATRCHPNQLVIWYDHFCLIITPKLLLYYSFLKPFVKQHSPHLFNTYFLSLFLLSLSQTSFFLSFSYFLTMYRHTVPAGLFTALVFVGITYELLNLFDASLNPVLALILGKRSKPVHVCFRGTMTVNCHHHALSIVRHHHYALLGSILTYS